MCRLFGILNFDHKTHKELLESFFALAETGNVLPGDPPGHKDGWGIGYYSAGTAKVAKSGNSASEESKRISDTLQAIGNSPVLIAHLRKSAWKDTSVERHAHPFSFNNLIFAHNGTVRDFQKNMLELKPGFAPAADSKDTEVFFRYIIQNSANGIEAGLRSSAGFVRKNNAYSALNLLLTDGKKLFALRDYAGKSGYAEYYTLFKSPAGIISSEPLGTGYSWAPMDNGAIEVLEIGRKS